MPDPFAFVLAILFTYRLAELLTIDRIFFRLRLWAGVYDWAPGDVNRTPLTFWGQLLDCPYCVGVWVAFPLALWLAPSLLFPVVWLAVAGGQALLQTIGGRQA